MQLKFTHPTFSDGDNVTVRLGTKWVSEKEDISRIGEQIANLDPRTGSFC